MPNRKSRHGTNKSGALSGRWKKGHSCASNPTSRKYRSRITSFRGDLMLKQRPNVLLTPDVVAAHNELTGGIQHMEVAESQPLESAMSEGGETCATFLSGLTDCTNVTFRKIQGYWGKNQHQEVCAVLAAITEVIREKGGSESLTDYFGALVTALETTDELESKAAIVHLLAMTVSAKQGEVSRAVLQKEFGRVSQLLYEILKAAVVEGGDMSTAMVESTISALSTLLRKVAHPTWADASCQDTYNMLLQFIGHHKSKCRKAAQDGVAKIICPRLTDDSNGYHPATAITSEYCKDKLSDLKKASNTVEVCHTLQLMGRILHTFQRADLRKSIEQILSHMSQHDVIVKSVCMQTILKMFVNAPSINVLSIDLNSKMLDALYPCQPNLVGEQLSRDWLNMMQQGVSNLLKNCAQVPDAGMQQLKHVEKFCKCAFNFLISDSQAVSGNAFVAVQNTLKDLGEFVAKQEMETKDETLEKVIESLSQLFMTGLNYKYKQVWDRVFKFYQIGFESFFNKARFSIFSEGLASIANFRNTKHFLYQSELDVALGAAIKNLGPETFLEAVPLLLYGTDLDDKEFSRSWIIPLLKQYVFGADLRHFFNYFCPLADSFRKRAVKCSGNQEQAYQTLVQQCWELLPSYCQYPVNLKIALKEKPKVSPFKSNVILLDKTLKNEETKVQKAVMQALRNLVNYATKKSNWEEREEAREVLMVYGKNFLLDALFSTYVVSDEKGDNENKSETQLAALETIRHLVRVMPTGDVVECFNKVDKRISSGTMKDQQQLSLYDLLVAMVQWVDAKTIEDICGKMESMLGSNNHHIQKKAYRIFEEVCASDNELCKAYLRTHALRLVDKFNIELRSAAASSKGARLWCMDKMVASLSSSPDTTDECKLKQLVSAILPECISCLRDTEKSRKAAFALLVTCGRAFEDSLDDFVTMAFLGLNGSDHLVSCTIFALSRLVYEYKEKMSPQILKDTIIKVCDCLATNTREICKAALGFVMVLFSFNDNVLIKGYYKEILKAMHEWKGETQSHFRDWVRKILQRLVRKLGFEAVNMVVTSEDLKRQLNYIRKMNERAKKKKDEGGHGGDGDSSDDDEDSRRIKSMDEILADVDDEESAKKGKRKVLKAKRRKHAAVMMEDDENDPIDLLDSNNVSNKIITTKINKKKVQSEEFKTGKDGRLIIDFGVNDEESNDDEFMKNIGVTKASSSVVTMKRKRKQQDGDGDDDDEDDMRSRMSGTTTRSGYRPGGKGIHRDTSSVVSQFNDGSQFRSKKARGDMKKANQDPYAYIPVSIGMLNRRKRKKSTGQFDGLINAAKKGAAKGKKQKGGVGGKKRRMM